MKSKMFGDMDLSQTGGGGIEIIGMTGGVHFTTFYIKKLEYLSFFICPHLYRLPLKWQIKQKITPENPRGFIEVKEILDNKLEYIYDKFDRLQPIIGVNHYYGNFSTPHNIFEYFDKNLIVLIPESY